MKQQKSFQPHNIGFTDLVIGTINCDSHAAVTNGTSDLKFPLGLGSFATNSFCMEQVFILLSEKLG